MSQAAIDNALKEIQQNIDNEAVVMYGETWCPHCKKADNAIKKHKSNYKAVWITDLDSEAHSAIKAALKQMANGQTSVPQIWINGDRVPDGGSGVVNLDTEQQLGPRIQKGEDRVKSKA